ncbi:baseplate multidomain protein megatron [Gymnodinialimonas ceratoperidinii]|uniref:Glycoside hydrolase TIM-barrel-like domain-containing protein n=1 Tax=Gymnodinialimonas ceratoperidinii TaxID=2856823 RepID=A0A8F6TUE8_9RHOB|nr:glycoside hydrolase TIM-barrel-like domain-containing protein [Gymnodinialimonas ceratoperidinii]QXT38880.1 glycoside hydrolase TIM-barrel-like domain-containing protein [Gymnodinialimonas ceratoperidinii]
MATLLLSAAGAAVGGLIQAPILGMTGAVLGRAVGATVGRVIDQRLMGSGSDPVEMGQTDRLRITGAGEGAPIAQLFGRMRLGGHVIWATQFQEHKSTSGGSGKGAPPQPKTTTYSYTISLAIALCEGEIARVGRIWADGVEIDREAVTWRLYKGADDQMPDPLLEAVEGAGAVPAFRGTAYVVFEDLDLTPYGNRVPQFAFEVVRPAQPERPHVPSAAEAVRAVALMPGTGEYALATTPVSHRYGLARGVSTNVSAEGGVTDFSQSLGQLRDTLPNLESVSLIYSWFGDDLRAGHCKVRPKVEQAEHDGREMPWRAGGIDRQSAEVIAKVDGRAVYGGTPADDSVLEAIAAIHAGGQEVTFYPFLLMEMLEGNGLPDPYGGAEQPALPWRGRITGDVAPGHEGTTDATPANRTAIDAFFGTAQASDFSTGGSGVGYSGPSEWSYSRFILHCAALCAQAGGVEAFCIGSEMRGLTQMRDDQGYPAVEALIALASEVRALLPQAKITYAADWSEYFGYHPQDGSGDVYFHLDALWADPNIDMVAIDNYMPVSDWRDGTEHLDFEAGPIHALDYLQSNIEGGEGYAWFYTGPEAQAAQRRTEITDGMDEPWIYRFKDLRNWWEQPHSNRIGGFRTRDLPILGEPEFEGKGWASGYWVRLFNHAISALPGMDPITYYGSATVETAPGEGDVLQVAGAYLTCSERGYRPMVPGQEVRVTIRMRLLAEPTDGEPHKTSVYLAFNRENGNPGGSRVLFTVSDTHVSDGWIEQSATVTPEDWVGVGAIWPDASHWRVMVALNGPTTGSPAGAVLQVSEVTVAVENAYTDWVPRSKPIWFTEFGCAAIDKGTNQPNKFLDPKSDESAIPTHSNGRRDDLIQAQYLRAVMDYWQADEKNPPSDQYDGRMLDMGRAHAWAWDARVWPAFPNDRERWSDGDNWTRGHWLTGRLDAQPLDLVVAEICEEAGVTDYDVSRLFGLVRGHVSAQTQSARARLQPLMLTHGFHAVERDGKLVFLTMPQLPETLIDAATTARDDDDEGGFTHIRAPEAETVGRLRISYTEAEGGYGDKVAEAVFPGDGADKVNDVNLPLALTTSEGQSTAERWLAEGRVAKDTLRFALPPSQRAVGAGALIATEDGQRWRVDRVEDRGFRQIEAVRVEPSTATASDEVEEAVRVNAFVPPLPVTPIFLDLPLLTGDEVAHAPHLAVAADPWPGSAAVYSAPGPDGFTLNKLVEQPAIIGTLLEPLYAQRPGVWDRAGPVRIRLETGSLSSSELSAVLTGGNGAAIGSGEDDIWEVMQFADATLVAPDTWEIGMRLRGQQGTDALMPDFWPAGSVFVLLDGGVTQVDLSSASRGLERHWRIGPARRSVDDPSYVEKVVAFQGNGLRPYSPVHLRAPRDGAAREVSWIRRSRIDADSWDGTDVPLGEASEQYILRIVDANETRREEVLSVPQFTYTDAMRASDGTLSDYAIEVAQVSERFGAGPNARIQINE